MNFNARLCYTSALCLFPALAAATQPATLSVIHSFSGPDGATPVAGLLVAANGTLYGTTAAGGNGFGTVFGLYRSAQNSGWTEMIIHSFTGTDGESPSASLLGLGGSLYGTTANGGSKGFGTVFQLTPNGTGQPWTETTLYNFLGGTDGRGPFGNLVADSKGNLYGTTTYGGTTTCTAGLGCGTIFELSPPATTGQPWTETVLYRFQSGADGANPLAGPIFGQNGSLYGATPAGGSAEEGTVFRLAPPAVSGGAWIESIIYSFTSRADGQQPNGGLTFGTAGNIYGTTTGGGSYGCGTVFALTPPASGTLWTKSILHQFNCSDGAYPEGSLLLVPGYVYGTASGGGANQTGSIFMLTAPTTLGTPWTETILASLQSSSSGANPAGNLVINSAGALFGTAMSGGSGSSGTVFKIIP